MVWYCVGNCFVFVKLFHYVRLACFVCLFVVLSRALLFIVFCVCQVCSYSEMGLIDRLCLCLSIASHYVDLVCVFVFCMLLSRLFVFVSLVTFAWHVLTDCFAYGIHARARLIIRCSECDVDHVLPGRQFSGNGLSL